MTQKRFPQQPALLAALTLLVLTACATASPFRQSYVRIETDRFEILSAFDPEETALLAAHLATFEAGIDFALGRSFEPDRESRTLVLAFDDRGLIRPFAIRGRSAYWLPYPDRPVLVFRAPGGWDRRASRDLLHQYAHRVIRARARTTLPAWFEEGLAQMLGAIEIRGRRVEIGRPIPEFVDVVRDWRRSSFADVLLGESDTSATPSDRMRFAALSWAVVHNEWTAGKARRAALREPFDSISSRQSTDGSSGLGAIAREVPKTQASEVWKRLKADRVPVDRIRVTGELPSESDTVPVPSATAVAALAELADRLDRRKLALQYYDRALESEPDFARALAGHARAWALDPVPTEEASAEGRVRRALERAPDRVSIQTAAAEFYRRLASSDLSYEEEAIARFERAIATDPSSIDALLGLARMLTSAATRDEEAATRFAAASDLLDRAATIRPGALDVELARAELELRSGRKRAARARAEALLQRSHGPPYRDRARMLLEATLESD